MSKQGIKKRKRIFEVIEVGNDLDKKSRVYDYLNVSSIIVILLLVFCIPLKT